MKECKNCSGTKLVNGMGGMKEKCPQCKGKGYVNPTPEVIVKRGRPKKDAQETSSL